VVGVNCFVALGVLFRAMIRLPILKDELASLEGLLPELETRPGLGHLAIAIKARIEKIRREIHTLEATVGKSSK
jgi:hypothetical protein